MRFEVFRDSGGKNRWRLVGGDGCKLATARESFFSKSDAAESAQRFKAHASRYAFAVYSDRRGQARWRATAPNGRTVAASGEAFDTPGRAQRAADNVQDNAGSADGP
jgi:uncharacterized protein YegP (UPF0339 family)